MKANNHPIVKDLRRMLDIHKMKGAVLVMISEDGRFAAVSAGKTRALCDAIGPVLKEPEISHLAYEIDSRIIASEKAR